MKRNFLIFIGVSIGMMFFQNCSKPVAEKVDSSSTASLFFDRGVIVCPAIKCQAPAEGCESVANPIEPGVCPSDCGTVICKGPKICPMIMCAAPPENCHYEGPSANDETGCAFNCGNLVCDGTL